MGLLYEALCNRAAEHKADDLLYKTMRMAPVYEVTNVLSLFQDWKEATLSPVPKKPPHTNMWVEWEYTWDGHVRVTHGCHLWQTSKAVGQNSRTDIKGEDFWIVVPYARINSSTGDNKAYAAFQGSLVDCNLSLLVGLSLDGQIQDQVGLDHTAHLWGLKTLDFMSTGGGGFAPWVFPPFMAFSLLHCRNVTTETIPGEPNPPRLIRRGWPPLKKEYKVLRLELPKDVRPHGVVDSTETERHVRFHLCRGHFKNLQNERYKNKGWHWWPAHWKGSKDIGTIEKRYELASAGNLAVPKT